MKIGINTPLFQWDANAEADAMPNLARAAAEAKATTAAVLAHAAAAPVN